ncbi:MAG: sigma-54-dependent Fis family transcriptional regulator [Spirochaetaceae bacterium]|nr:MAG: sigma-54-dependent Fis family transcriptional regulator [Spirochaetaceae bacterium]
MKYNVLVVDDEKNIREGLGRALELDSYKPLLAGTGDEALQMLNKEEVDLVISDLKMPGLPGEELLKRIVSHYPTVPVIILTGHGTVESAVKAMHDGAYDFITKPPNLERLSLLVKKALSKRELFLQHRELEEELLRHSTFPNMIGTSSEMQKIYQIVSQVAPTRASVLITGDSGVGKELVADAIHHNSPRKDKPFIKVHCAALSESLLESELFGHEKGSFTGALSRRRGRFELAHMGTIFLDEIGEINQNLQIKILRVLQDKKFERVGGEETIEVDVRIIAATNRDLKDEIEKGNFREDLFYRLNVVNIHVPGLRERKEDIPLLIASFINEFAVENSKGVEGINPKARAILSSYAWPGNIRELRNCIESAVVMCKGPVISPEDLPSYIQAASDDNYIRIRTGTTLDEAEKEILLFTLNQQGGNKSRTAEVLGIGRKTLHRKLEEYGIKE